METDKYNYSFNASLDVLEKIRGIITDIGKKSGYKEKDIYKLKLAVDEIATNIIRHGYMENGVKNGTFDMKIVVDDKKLILTLIDNAVQFNPLEHIGPGEEDLKSPLEDRPIGGLGVMIAKQSVDEYKYKYLKKKNNNIFVVNKN